MLSQKEFAQKVISHINKLPPMPENISKLRLVCADPNANFSLLTPIIEEDPGLCADILHIANSAYYGISHKVDTISEAVRYFGMDQLIDFVSLSFSNKVVRKQYQEINNLNQYFKHSKEIAIASKIIAKNAGRSKKYQDFFHVCGLLHDIGRLIVFSVSDDQTRSDICDSWIETDNLIENEQKCLGLDHCVIGMKICEKWKFSERLQNTILKHHLPLKDGLCHEAAIVLLAHFITMPEVSDSMLINLYKEDVLSQLGLNSASILKSREDFFIDAATVNAI